MHGIGNTNEWEQLFEPNINRQESPQLMQGLLGSSGEPNNTLEDVILRQVMIYLRNGKTPLNNQWRSNNSKMRKAGRA